MSSGPAVPATGPGGTTAGDLLCAALVRSGVGRLYRAAGAPVVGSRSSTLRVIDVPDDPLALLMADADGRVNGGLGAAFVSGGFLHLSSQPGGVATPRRVTDAAQLVLAVATAPGAGEPDTSALLVDLDLDSPAVDPGWPGPPTVTPVILGADLAAVRGLILAGPGVVRRSASSGLRIAAEGCRWPVLNTFGAKGVLRWDHPLHAGTAGLQELDWELAGVASARLLLVVGLDPAECGPEVTSHPGLIEADPRLVDLLFPADPDRPTTPGVPPGAVAESGEPRAGLVTGHRLFDTLAAVIRPLYERETVPLTPARASLHLAGVAGQAGGVIVADGDDAGLWVGRSFPTTEPGSIVVAAHSIEGTAAAGTLAARLAGRPAVGVSAAPGEMSERVLDLARSLGVGTSVQVWGPEGVLGAASEHAAATTEMATSAEVGLVSVPVELDLTVELERVAGASRWQNARGGPAPR